VARHQFFPLNSKTLILDAKILYVKLFLPPLASRPLVDYINTMPDKRTHRGPHPEDAKLFAVANIPALREAVADYSMLLTKGYAVKSALKLIGDHFSLTQRQRLALMRSACSDSQLTSRRQREIPVSELCGESIVIDGYNLLITIEAALGGAAVLLCRDGCIRDLAGIHGTYRKVNETVPAIKLIAGVLSDIGIKDALWLFDSPVSNSGRLKTMIYELIEQNGWPWQVELFTNPDTELIRTEKAIATSDSDVLDKCRRWSNLAGHIIEQAVRSANLIDLSDLEQC